MSQSSLGGGGGGGEGEGEDPKPNRLARSLARRPSVRSHRSRIGHRKRQMMSSIEGFLRKFVERSHLVDGSGACLVRGRPPPPFGVISVQVRIVDERPISRMVETGVLVLHMSEGNLAGREAGRQGGQAEELWLVRLASVLVCSGHWAIHLEKGKAWGQEIVRVGGGTSDGESVGNKQAAEKRRGREGGGPSYGFTRGELWCSGLC